MLKLVTFLSAIASMGMTARRTMASAPCILIKGRRVSFGIGLSKGGKWQGIMSVFRFIQEIAIDVITYFKPKTKMERYV